MSQPHCNPRIILASTSIFRKQLLEKLHIPFETQKPDVDETPLQHESVAQMVQRLSEAKAQAIASNTPNALIIGSDQSAVFNGLPIGKPLTPENAIQQLKQFSGKTIEFITGLAVMDTRNHQTHYATDITKVTFRSLTENEIINYLNIEQPYQCAGSFKSEGLGITLFNSIETSDPNALIGLPLIQLTTILKQCGLPLPPEPTEPT